MAGADRLRRLAYKVPQVRRLHDQREALRCERDELSAELTALRRQTLPSVDSPFYHYHATFDPIEVMRRHAAPDVVASPGHLTNFLGVRIDPKFLPHVLAGRAGEVEDIPIPANWHADIAEWGAVLRAVDLARGHFTVVELGCGWGCWLNNAGVAARRAGLAVTLVGVEADAGHIGFAKEACAANGFAPETLTLHRGVAAASSGWALFPRQEEAGINWGLEPVFGASEEQRGAAKESSAYDELPMIGLDDIMAPHDRIDMLHIDIQGGEADFIAGCLPALQARVAYLVIGTHSRPIEGAIMQTLLGAGFILEMERPAILVLAGNAPTVKVDGVQGWRNAGLCCVV